MPEELPQHEHLRLDNDRRIQVPHLLGADAASSLLKISEPGTFHTGLDDLRTILRTGPSGGVHVIGWWRGARRFVDDIGGSTNLEDVVCIVALNVSGNDLGTLIGDYKFEWHARPNRAMVVDRHDQKTQLIVPFVRPGTYDHVYGEDVGAVHLQRLPTD